VIARGLYTLFGYLAMPAALFYWWWRGRKQPAYREHLAERFGFYSQAFSDAVWIHSVSVGETRAAMPLVNALRRAYPELRILLTHITPTGRETAAQLYGDQVTSVYLPYDTPDCVGRFLRHFRPRLCILIETELWPNLMHGSAARGLPLFLVNARLSEKSLQGYLKFRALIAPVVRTLRLVAAQTEADAQRLRTLGAANVRVCGNLKFDIHAPEELLQRGRAWRERIGATRSVFLAASTREGEEPLLLDTLDRLPAEALLILVPRHPQRFNEVAALLKARGLAFARRGAEAMPDATTRVWLGDSMGELFAYYAACDLAYVGGSLLPLGGQNLIEAAACGKPVLVGPHTFNFAGATRLALEAGAALQLPDAGALMEQAARLLRNPAERMRMGEATLRFARQHQGATKKVMEWLRPAIKLGS
jgi:3-deoxy-D-manno-octulosonic-acid transferase